MDILYLEIVNSMNVTVRKNSKSCTTTTATKIEEMEDIVKRLLEPIQKSISKLATAEYLDSKISELQNNIKIKFDEQNEKIQKIEARMDELEGTVTFLQNSLELQSRHIDDLEQYGRRLCLRFLGIPMADNETSNDVLQKVKDEIGKLGVVLPDAAYDRAHRIGTVQVKNGQKQQAVIVRFTSWSSRTQVYRAREKGKGVKIKIRLDLTRKRLELLNECSDFIEHEGLDEYFIYADVNCRLAVMDSNKKSHFFNTKHEFDEIMAKY